MKRRGILGGMIALVLALVLVLSVSAYAGEPACFLCACSSLKL